MGDPACWLDRVCAVCGSVADDLDEDRVCGRCAPARDEERTRRVAGPRPEAHGRDDGDHTPRSVTDGRRS